VTVVSLARVFISYLVHPLYLTEANSSDPRTNRVGPQQWDPAVGQMFRVPAQKEEELLVVNTIFLVLHEIMAGICFTAALPIGLKWSHCVHHQSDPGEYISLNIFFKLYHFVP
jgi:hypothetical protein